MSKTQNVYLYVTIFFGSYSLIFNWAMNSNALFKKKKEMSGYSVIYLANSLSWKE